MGPMQSECQLEHVSRRRADGQSYSRSTFVSTRLIETFVLNWFQVKISSRPNCNCGNHCKPTRKAPWPCRNVRHRSFRCQNSFLRRLNSTRKSTVICFSVFTNVSFVFRWNKVESNFYRLFRWIRERRQLVSPAGDVWICKPSGLNQGNSISFDQNVFLTTHSGKGIYLVRDVEALKKKFAELDTLDKKKQVSVKPMKRIIQRYSTKRSSDLNRRIFSLWRYIMNPLLIHGKKFDIRCYMLISSVKPLIIFYHSGYIRLSMFDFDPNDGNLLTHLTNQVAFVFHRSQLDVESVVCC